MKDYDHDFDGSSWFDLFGSNASDQELLQTWSLQKAKEKEAAEERRKIEDELLARTALEQAEGSKTIKLGTFKVKITQRFNRSIDADALQELASEHGLTSHLGSLFRWKPEINAKAWKDAGEDITAPLLKAITTKPGRPSFAIEPLETK